MSSKNIQTELEQLRYKVRLLKESNTFENNRSEKAQNLFSWERNLINGKNKNEWETKQLVNDEEAFVVANCYRKSIELIKKHAKQKKKKHKILNSVDSVIHSCNENMSANYAAELSNIPFYDKKCDCNMSHKSKKFNGLQSTSECEVANYHLLGNACDNSQEKRKIRIRNKKKQCSSSAISKHIVDKYSQNELEMQMKESNMNIETLTDVVFLKTVTHSKEKKKSKSSTKKTDENEIYNVTFNAYDKMKQYPNSNTKDRFEQKHPEIKQKETEAPHSAYLNTVNVSLSITALKDIDRNCKQIIKNSERINSTNYIRNNALQSISDQNNHISLFQNECDSVSSLQATKIVSENSWRNENWFFPAELKTSDCLIDLSSGEDEPETIVPVWDFTDEPVDFTVPALHINERSDLLSKPKIQFLESNGIVIKKGKWSEKETALLIRNYKDFVDQFGINDARLLLGIGRQLFYSYENQNVIKFLKAKHFLVRLGKDINHRLLNSIYGKARAMFHPLRYKRKNGINDISFLLQLQKKYRNKWELIAKKFGRPAKYCMNLYLQNRKCFRKGKWLNEEIENLLYAVKKVSKSSFILTQNLKSISWIKVSELVKTRTPSQCWMRWNRTKKKLGLTSNLAEQLLK